MVRWSAVVSRSVALLLTCALVLLGGGATSQAAAARRGSQAAGAAALSPVALLPAWPIPDDLYLSAYNPSASANGDHGRFDVQFNYKARSLQWGYQLYVDETLSATGPATGKGTVYLGSQKIANYDDRGKPPTYHFHSRVGGWFPLRRLEPGDVVAIQIEIRFAIGPGQERWTRMSTRVHI